jgi:hypothetical protein
LIPEDSKFFCFDYSTPYLFEAAGANLNNPEPNDFSEAFKYCDKIPANEERNRNSCYGGFGKEFVVLVRGRDIRKASIANISDDNLKTVFRWCSLADNKNGTAACLLHSVDSLFWGGENDVIFSLSFCGLLSDDKFYQGSCYNHLISIVHHYIKDSQYINNFCHKLPTQHKDLCLSRIKS